MKKLLSTKLAENKKNYSKFLFKFWDLLKKWKIKNQEDVRKILADFNIDEKIKKRFLITFEKKKKISEQKIENLKKFEENLNNQEGLIKEILQRWWNFIKKDFVWWFILSKQTIKEIFFKQTKWFENIDSIGFYLKDYSKKLDFDLIIVSDQKLIEHEYNEAFFELFLTENTKRISLFNLWDIQENEKTLFNGVLTDIFLHLLSLENKQEIQTDLEKYISYLDFAVLNDEDKKETLLKVKTYLRYFLNILHNVDEIRLIKWLLANLSYPSKLLTYLTDNKIDFEKLNGFYNNFEKLIPKFEEIKWFWEFQLFNLLSSNKFDVRYCTIITRKVTQIQKEIIKEKNKKILKTPLNVKNSNIEYVLWLYLEHLKKRWEIVSYTWDLKSWITLDCWNGLKDKVVVLEDGSIWIESEYFEVKEIEKEVTKEQTIDHRREWREYLIWEKKIGEEKTWIETVSVEWWLTNGDVWELPQDFEAIEKQEQEKVETLNSELSWVFDKQLSEIMEYISQEAKNLWFENDLSQEEVEVSDNMDIIFYESAVVDAINVLNKDLKKQYLNAWAENIEQYLFKELEWFRKLQETKEEKILRLVFSRYHIIWSTDLDQVVVDVQIDKKTWQTNIRMDWQWMCSAHQFFDDYVAKYLEQIWWIWSSRIDQNQTNWEITNFQKQKNLDTNVL